MLTQRVGSGVCALALLASSGVACAMSPPKAQSGATPAALKSILHAHPSGKSATPFTGLRAKAIKDAARTLALQTGVDWRTKRIDTWLENHAQQLNATFNFTPLMLCQCRC